MLIIMRISSGLLLDSMYFSIHLKLFVHIYSILTITSGFSLSLHKTTLDDRIISDDKNNPAHFTMY